eukprot:Rhum_TRINITY_DN3034_c0_g2::Rhum_TRINITY_DN3034_c0_g2_i1::g.9339::m.9339
MPDGGEHLRRCILCTNVYQSDATAFAVSQKNAEWVSFDCSKCEVKIWYVRGHGTSVCCWNCRYVNATLLPENEPVEVMQRTVPSPLSHPAKPKLLSMGSLFGRRNQKNQTPSSVVKKEGLCSTCTRSEAGLPDPRSQWNKNGDDKDAGDPGEDAREPPSPTSLEACVLALIDTEWSLRRFYADEEDEAAQDMFRGFSDIAGPAGGGASAESSHSSSGSSRSESSSESASSNKGAEAEASPKPEETAQTAEAEETQAEEQHEEGEQTAQEETGVKEEKQVEKTEAQATTEEKEATEGEVEKEKQGEKSQEATEEKEEQQEAKQEDEANEEEAAEKTEEPQPPASEAEPTP